MPRNPSTGVYSKPAGTTPSVGQVIDPAPWNALTTDLGNEITNSLPRDGSAPMGSPLKLASGTVSAPGLGFATTPQTGLYLKGGGLLGFTQNGVDLALGKATVYAAKAGDYTAVAADDNAVHRFTANANLTLTAAATLGANWQYVVIADGGTVTIDPNGAETIDGAATLTVPNGYATYIICSGVAFFTDKVLTRLVAKAELTDVADHIVDIVPAYVSTTSISVSSGSAFCGSKSFSISSTLTKVFTSTFVAGNNGGVLDTGAIGASKTYFLYAIRRTSDGAGDIVASLSATPAGVTMTNLTGWEVLTGSRVGIVLSNASSQIIKFVQRGNKVLTENSLWFTASADVAFALAIPPNIPIGLSVDVAITLSIQVSTTSADCVMFVSDADAADALINANPYESINCRARTGSGFPSSSLASGFARSNSSGQLCRFVDTNSATVSASASVQGWIDYSCRRIAG